MKAEHVKNYLQQMLEGGPSVIVNAIDSNAQQCIGVFDPRTPEKRRRCLGGGENTRYQIKSFSILVHWTDSPVVSEAKAKEIMELFDQRSDLVVDGIRVCAAEAEYPRWAGRAQNRVCEYIVPVKFTYEEVKNDG